MNFSKFSIFASIFVLSTLAVAYAKSVDKGAKVEGVSGSEDPSMAKDAGGASSEGASSDFDIQQLLKMIEALKDQDFDGFEEMIKDSKLGDDKNTESKEVKGEEGKEKTEESKSADVMDEDLKDEL